MLCAVRLASAAGPGARVVLVDPDPELRRAMTTALRPWKLEVIVDTTPVDEAGAAARADALNARFVVWRRGKDLVVFDRERGDTQHREVAEGALDPVDAASAALTVKTLMRLPPPPEDQPEQPAVPAAEEGSELRVQATAATRLAFGSDTVIGGRLQGAVMVRPLASFGVRLGLLGDIGSSDKFKRASFEGTWFDWSVLVIAGWTTMPRERLEVEPFVAGGLTRSRVRGSEDNMGMGGLVLDERDTLPAIRAGSWVRYRLADMWTVGASVAVDLVPGTPTYTRPMNGRVLYEVPGFGLSLGVTVAVDLGR